MSMIYTYDCPYCGFQAAENREEDYYEVETCTACGYRNVDPKKRLYKEISIDKNGPSIEKAVRDYLDEEEGRDRIPTKADIATAREMIASLEIIEPKYNSFIVENELRDFMQDITLFNRELVKVII